MKTLFIMSLACASTSLLAIVGISVITFVPGPGVEGVRAQMMMVAGGFALAWLGVAAWARMRRHRPEQLLPPRWLRGLLVGVSVVYLLGVWLLFLG